MEALRTFELWILDQIQIYMGSDLMDGLWQVITHLGDLGLIWLLITIGLIIYPQTRKLGWLCLIAILLGAIMTNGLLKNLVQRARPYNFSDIRLLIPKSREFSFPSGHTTASFAVGFVILKEKLTIKAIKVYIPFMILAGLIAFSRLYLYVHFPTDIIVGILIGYLCSILANPVYERITKMKLNSKQSS